MQAHSTRAVSISNTLGLQFSLDRTEQHRLAHSIRTQDFSILSEFYKDGHMIQNIQNLPANDLVFKFTRQRTSWCIWLLKTNQGMSQAGWLLFANKITSSNAMLLDLPPMVWPLDLSHRLPSHSYFSLICLLKVPGASGRMTSHQPQKCYRNLCSSIQ